MSFCKLYIAETLIEGYIKAPLTLKKQTLSNIAIKLCHDLKLKKQIFSPKLKMTDLYFPEQLRKQWEKSLKKESTKICKTFFLPHTLQEDLIGLIRSIALQLLTWSGRWKAIFDIPCQFTADIWVPADWLEDRIDERKIAKRLMLDERMSILERYRLACVYCLEEFIPRLWYRIPSGEREKLAFYDRNSNIVKYWSTYMTFPGMFSIEEVCLKIFYEAMLVCETTALIFAWNKFSDDTKRDIISVLGDETRVLEIDTSRSEVLPFMNNYRMLLLPPLGYGDILCFLLKQQMEQEGIAAFKEKFDISKFVKYLLEWPY